MSNYYREQSYHSRKRALRRLRYIVLGFLLVVLVGIGFLAYDIYRESIASNNPGPSTTEVTSTITTGNEIQTNPYFQFQTPEKWKAIANETKDGHYVYRQFNGPLVEQEFIVDVNRGGEEVLALVQTTRVMPVSVTENGNFKLEGNVSEHCKKAVPKGTEHTQQTVKMSQVTFACNPDSVSYLVVVGVIGGGTAINMPRLDGSSLAYRISYRNVTATPNSRDLDDMLKTFQSL